jgi:copper(I)-binding protein
MRDDRPARRAVRLLAVVALLGATACRPAARGGRAAVGHMAVSHAVVSAPAGPMEAPAFLLLANRGPAADTLVAVDCPDADSVSLHTVTAGRMLAVSGIAVPARGRVRLAPGEYHLMLEGLRRPLAVGDTVTLELHFAAAGLVQVRAPVLRYTEAVREVQ